jgi:uncharacterized protein YdhG (YjbR/CyaY superfamily)
VIVATQFESIDDYIASFRTDVQAVLETVRRTIRKAAPGTKETISYGMPTFTLNGRYVVYFAGWKHHVSLYPAAAGDEALDSELSLYRAAKGTLKSPLREPVPHELIERLVAALMRNRQEGAR